MRVLYDLAGADEACRFSPYCWRIAMALAHKGLTFETMPVRFTDKPLIAFSGQDRVPVLRDGGDKVVSDSWVIAAYLETAYPERPSLFGGAQGRALTDFIRHWTERVVHTQVLPLIILDILARLGRDDAAYFRSSREARFGRRLEEVAGAAEEKRAALKTSLSPLRATLSDQPFVAGHEPAFADYVVFGAFQWARVVSPHDLLDGDDPVVAWRERMLDLFGGLARSTPAAH
jgi:glutathione S-transferase